MNTIRKANPDPEANKNIKNLSPETKEILEQLLLFMLLCWIIEHDPSSIQRALAKGALLMYVPYAYWISSPVVRSSMNLQLWLLYTGGRVRTQKEIPPTLADWTLCFFLSRDQRQIILGDLEEDFPKWVDKYGRAKAISRYRQDVITAAKPGLWRMARRIFYIFSGGAIAKLGIGQTQLEYIRSWLNSLY